ncbi:MAG TPA: hypothetical protein VKH37_13555 [Ferruginibacter sp.]|nr:hypothetical protein [Ferruginibacter sp.]
MLSLNETHKKRYAIFYIICFGIYYCWYWFHGILLHQIEPVFYHNRLDLTTNIVMMSGLQSAIIRSPSLQLVLDGLFILLPLLMCAACVAGSRIQRPLAILTAIFNLVYAIMLSLMSPLSIEGFTGWMLLPLLFAFKKEASFYYILHCLRYLFILIFSSSALWKICTGAVFNTEQMSAILANQHAAYLVSANGDWYANLITYFIGHQNLSYCIYLAATLAELVFVVGFFTKKWDRILIVIFLLFVAVDYFLMRINYFSWVAFMGCFRFSRYQNPLQKM